MIGSFALRALAVAQMAFEAGQYVASAVKRWAYGARKEYSTINEDGHVTSMMEVGQGYTRNDLAVAAKHLGTCIRTGHVDRRTFYGAAAQDEVDLSDPVVLHDDGKVLAAVLNTAKTALRSGALRSGLLPTFVMSQTTHLLGCKACTDAVLQDVRDAVVDGNTINLLLGRLGIGRSAGGPENDIDPLSVN